MFGITLYEADDGRWYASSSRSFGIGRTRIEALTKCLEGIDEAKQKFDRDHAAVAPLVAKPLPACVLCAGDGKPGAPCELCGTIRGES